MRKILEHCPACGGRLIVSELRCTRCETQVRGGFAPGELSALTEEQQTFVKLFLRTRGNLSEMEKSLGISYPTIRNKLDEVIKVLDRAEATAPAALSGEGERRAILDRVAAGTMTAAEALERLRKTKGAA